MSTPTTTSSTVTSTGAPKVSMFGAKSGFVIPKNKLSGSLVPVSRGPKNTGAPDAGSQTNNVNQMMHRNTRWGPDLTLDASVRKGRALAYQTRVEQITEQLKLGFPDAETNQLSNIADQSSELLDIERREAIGEILKLNPSYKAPPDYKPVLKEARFPLPVKEFPGHNFINLIFGSGQETQKRLEKETGVRLKIYGIKADTEREVEVAPDGVDSQVAYEELSVSASADSFDKVDAAVSVIELLLTPVIENPAKGDNASDQSLESYTSLLVPPVANQEGLQLVSGPRGTSHQGQLQCQTPWMPPVASHAPQNSGFIGPQNHPAPIPNPSAMPSLFGPPPAQASLFHAMLQPPLHPPRNFFSPAQTASVRSNISASFHFSDGPSVQAGLQSIARPTQPSLSQTVSSVQLGLQADQTLTTTGSSSVWSGVPTSFQLSFGPANMGPRAPPVETLQGPLPVVPPSVLPSFPPPSSTTGANIISPAPLPSGPSATNLQGPTSHLIGSPSYALLPPYPAGPPSRSVSILSPSLGMAVPSPSINHAHGSNSVSSSLTAVSQPNLQLGVTASCPGPAASFTRIRPPTAGDFTFHPSPNFDSQRFQGTNIQAATQTSLHPPSPQVPPFRLSATNSTPQPDLHLFSRPQASNHISQMQARMSTSPFPGNPSGSFFPPRFPVSSRLDVPPPPALQMPLRNSSPVQLPTVAGPFPPRPTNPLQLQQNFAVPMNLGGNLIRPNERFGGKPPASGSSTPHPGAQQIYDPFSPTSVAAGLQHQGDSQGKERNRENDPEYEDLMASVGVK